MERYTNPDCKPEMEELMKDCPRSRSGAECWLRLCGIEDILGDEYELDRLRELAPVRHAKWKYFHKQNKAVCTSCSFERDLDADFGRAIACPNCAARMDSDFYDSRRFLFLRPAKD